MYSMKIILFIVSFSLVVLSCKKEGCMNENATNYDAEVKKDDGSCHFEAKTSFWFSEGVSEFLVGPYEVTALTVYMDDVSVGTMDPADWKVGPDCNGENFTVVTDLGGFTGKKYSYSVRDNNGTQQFYGTVSLVGNDCKSVELKW